MAEEDKHICTYLTYFSNTVTITNVTTEALVYSIHVFIVYLKNSQKII